MASAPTPIRLSKHHGLGNDFLVCLTEHLPLDAVTRARTWCDRRTGIGADGLIFGLPPGPNHDDEGDIVMRLFNSDGSPAALSGNGLRCFAQAVARAQGVPISTSRCPPQPGYASAPCTAPMSPTS